MSTVASGIFNTLLRRNFVFVGAVFASAFAFEIGWDSMTDKLWDAQNRGRQWKDIKAKYMVKEDEEDDE